MLIAHHIASQGQHCSVFPYCLPSGNPILQALSLQGEIFINQITHDTYTYYYIKKLFISSGEIDHNMAEDVQKFLKTKNKSD